jgi:IS30 family transposase
MVIVTASANTQNKTKAASEAVSSTEFTTNENTNGLLRQYFPKDTDLSRHTQHVLDQAAYSLNTRPRQTLRDMTASERLAEVLQ